LTNFRFLKAAVVADFQLQHFYHGQVVIAGKPQGELQTLAASEGITPAHVADAMQEARIPPMPDRPDGAWGLLRGKAAPFYLVQAQAISGGQALRHVIVMPVDVLRAFGGNLSALETLIQPSLPTFERAGELLALLPLAQAGAPSADAQERAILNLMNYTRDRPEVIEALLAALIQGVPIVVIGAPPERAERRAFIEGLLALLPPPARFGVTFTTHASSATPIDAQIRFIHDAPPERGVVFDWEAAKVFGVRVRDEYARFIKSQLRLSIGRVIEQTAALAAVASWRMRRGEKLAEALRYAAHRRKIDDALLSGLAVETPEVARILGEDPTLSDELRVVYVKHLMAFALALEEVAHSDLLATAARGQPDLERVILAQMNEALAQGKADRVYKRLSRWMRHPLGFKGMYWTELLHRAALSFADMLAKAGDAEKMHLFLEQFRAVHSDAQIDSIVPQLIQIALPLRAKSPNLSLTLFAMAARSLSSENWRRFLAIKQIGPLPRPLQQLLAQLNAEDSDPAPEGLLARVVAGFTAEWRPLMAIRLAEAAVLAGRYRLLDQAAVEQVAAAALTPWGETHAESLRLIVRTLSVDELLVQLGKEGAYALLQILLARGAYDELANELIRHRQLLYPVDEQLEFAEMLHKLFAATPFPLESVSSALKTLSVKLIKPLPLAMAYFGALEQFNFPPTLDGVVAELAALVISNRTIVESIPTDLLLRLLDYYVQVRDGSTIVRLTNLMPMAAARRGVSGVEPLLRLVGMLDWEENVRQAGMEALRRYIRLLPDNQARQAIARLGEALGREIRRALEATLLLRRLTGGEAMADYAYSLKTLSTFLYDTWVAYVDKNRLPSIAALVNDLDSLRGGLTSEERLALSDAFLEFARSLYALASQHRKARGTRDDNEGLEGLLAGRGTAVSALDVFRVIGGYLAQGKRFISRAEREEEPHPLRQRAVHLLLRELQQMTRLIKTALRAFPSDERTAVDAEDIRAEIDSLWSEIALHERRALVKDVAIDCQRIAELTLAITDRADPRILQENGASGRRLDTLRQRPENTLEFYRFARAYFRTVSRADQ
jgi:hypothetical protein